MTNTIIDLSNMFYRSMFAVGGYNGPTMFTFDSQSELDQLMRKVATDITFIIRQLNPSRVVLTLDSKSWRKNIEIEENEGYKGQREKSEHLNWDNVFAIMNEFAEIAEANGFIYSKIENAEADDLMSLWKDEFLYNHHQHVILVSGDKDIKQLVEHTEFNNKLLFSTVFNPFKQGKSSKTLYHSNKFLEWLNEETAGDIFNRSIDMDKADFKKLVLGDVEFQELNGPSIGLQKVFCGDDGDNVPSIYTWMTKSKKGEDKTVRITNSKYEKIVEALNITTFNDLFKHIDSIKKYIEDVAEHSIHFSMEDRIKRQTKLVILDRSMFPEEIVHQFQNELPEKLNKPHIHPQSFNMNTFLEGTNYVRAKGSKNPSAEHSIFRKIDSINKALF